MLRDIEPHSYLTAEIEVTEVLEKLGHLKKVLIQYADRHFNQHDHPQFNVEETISHMTQVEEDLKTLDFTFFLDEKRACML